MTIEEKKKRLMLLRNSELEQARALGVVQGRIAEIEFELRVDEEAQLKADAERAIAEAKTTENSENERGELPPDTPAAEIQKPGAEIESPTS